GNNPLMEAGAVYIYKRTSSLWSPVQKLVGFDRTAGDYFGYAVSMNNTTLAIGAQYNDNDADGNFKNNNIGAVYIYELDSNDEWVFSQRIVASDGEVGDIFGTAVFLHGNYLFVSSIYDDHTTPVSISNAGSVYVFEKINGVWTEIQKIIPSDLRAYDQFGTSIAADGNFLVIGGSAIGTDLNNQDVLPSAGASFIFENQGGTWVQIQKIIAQDREAGAFFGGSVSIKGDFILIGASGEKKDEIGA